MCSLYNIHMRAYDSCACVVRMQAGVLPTSCGLINALSKSRSAVQVSAGLVECYEGRKVRPLTSWCKPGYGAPTHPNIVSAHGTSKHTVARGAHAARDKTYSRIQQAATRRRHHGPGVQCDKDRGRDTAQLTCGLHNRSTQQHLQQLKHTKAAHIVSQAVPSI
jgi:hypothetical protein